MLAIEVWQEAIRISGEARRPNKCYWTSLTPNNKTPFNKHQIKKQLQSIVGWLLWLAQGTRPDLSVITSLLAQHQSDPNPKHIDGVVGSTLPGLGHSLFSVE